MSGLAHLPFRGPKWSGEAGKTPGNGPVEARNGLGEAAVPAEMHPS